MELDIFFFLYIIIFLKKKNNKGMYVKKWNKLNLRCFIFFYSIEKFSQYCINDLLLFFEE